MLVYSCESSTKPVSPSQQFVPIRKAKYSNAIKFLLLYRFNLKSQQFGPPLKRTDYLNTNRFLTRFYACPPTQPYQTWNASFNVWTVPE